jgi:hypothetical protein
LRSASATVLNRLRHLTALSISSRQNHERGLAQPSASRNLVGETNAADEALEGLIPRRCLRQL